ncbi:MAG: dihydroorotate dehydrogenase electron transfer subunit [Nitrospinae bacterium]|nr:dihydroorotate dehydrogenase electron transfer subunit [Nitrospinota bacterium]MBI3813199.1 dihydroorotate dehydrogenase electron transfer subunit [Nitrospinota bacterium]
MQAIILENKKIINSYYKMKLSCDGILRPTAAGAPSPGQFMMIKVSPHYDPFLRRPMSFYRIDEKEGVLEILYQVVGKGTEIMSELKEGDSVDILAPLGRGFSIPEKMERAILVAGGIGVAPMVALAEKIRGKGQGARGKITVFIGGKTKNDILCKEDFKRIGAKVYIATEDGLMGKKGTCVDLFRSSEFENPQSAIRNPQSVIFACGPHGMLKAVADIAKDRDMPCQVSLDKRMACGTGACLGCVVKTKQKTEDRRQKTEVYKCVCKDGPVFDAEEINWEET